MMMESFNLRVLSRRDLDKLYMLQTGVASGKVVSYNMAVCKEDKLQQRMDSTCNDECQQTNGGKGPPTMIPGVGAQ